jgi:hypothetical protein
VLDDNAHPSEEADLLRQLSEVFAEPKRVYQTRTDAKGHPDQFEADFTYTFADGTVSYYKGLVREDFDAKAEAFPNRGIHEPTEHYNIEIQQYIGTKLNGKHKYDSYINVHILLDKQRQPFRAFAITKGGDLKFDVRLPLNQQAYQNNQRDQNQPQS